AAYLESLDEQARGRWQEALVGIPRRLQPVAAVGGATISVDPTACVHQARLQVYGDPQWITLSFWLQEITNEVLAQTIEDGRFTAARGVWQRCMVDGGYDVGAEPGAARTYVRTRAAPAVDTQLEKAVALRDAQCLRQADLWHITRTVQVSYE